MSRKNRMRAQQRQQAEDLDTGTEDLDTGTEEPVVLETETSDALHALAGDSSVYEEPEAAGMETEETEEDPYEVLERQFKEVKASNETLSAERTAERQRLRDLEAQTAQHQTNELHQHRTIIEHAIAAADAEKTDLRRAYREAREFGDIDAELAAQEAIFEADYKLRQLHAGHEAIRQRIDAPQNQPTAPAGDPVEHIIATNFSNPRDQAWLRQHKADIFGNERRQKLALAGHEVAVLKGIEPGTDAYYDFMDDHMGYEEQQTGGAQPQAAPAPRKKAPVSAPVSRVSAGGANEGARVSPHIAQLAADLGMTASEYVANQKAIASGKWHQRFSGN